MQFGIFDQNDHGRYPLTEQYDKRLELIAFYDQGGFRTYHMSEHHSLKLAEEICMLDHLSHGRLEVGIGRGASPHELDYFGVDADQAQAMYVEAYQVIMQALTRDEVNFEGKHYRFRKVPIDLKP